jgi:DNA gyrase inhibitor GyrI
MHDLEVRIENLPEMWVASVVAYGESPEAEAWQRMRAWAVSKGLWGDLNAHPIFGFNNPPPAPGKKQYGYELWLQMDGPQPDEDPVTFKLFEGGLFAVTACKLTGEPGIEKTWRMLWNWAQAGSYRWRRSQELERALNPDAAVNELILELYLPVEKTDG